MRIRLAKPQSEAFPVSLPISKLISFLSVVTNATEEDKEGVDVASASLAAAKEASVDVAAAAVLSELEEQKRW